MVAKEVLHERLRAVTESLAAARLDCDIERVHELRVNIRRASAALRLFRKLLNRKDVKWIRKQFRSIRLVTGHARDLDIVADYMRRRSIIGRDRLASDLDRQRTKAQKPIADILRNLEAKHCLNDRIAGLLADFDCQRWNQLRGTSSHSEWLWRMLRPDVRQFFQVLRRDLHGAKSEHRLRIVVKKMRYSLELFPAKKTSQRLYILQELLKEMQGLIGEIRDIDVAQKGVKKLLRSTKGRRCVVISMHLRKLEKKRKRRLRAKLKRLISQTSRLAAKRLHPATRGNRRFRNV